METLWYQHELSRGSERQVCWLDDAVPVDKYVTLKGDDGGRWKVEIRYKRGFPKDQTSAHRKAQFASIQ